MNNQEICASFIGRSEPSPLLAVNARGMSFVHNQEGIVRVRDREQVFKQCEIAIHAIEALDYDPDPPRSARGTPVANCAFDNLRVVTGADSKRGSASSCSFLNAGVNQGIKDEQVVACGNVVSTAKLAISPRPKKGTVCAPKNRAAAASRQPCSSQLPRRSRDPPALIGVPARAQ